MSIYIVLYLIGAYQAQKAYTEYKEEIKAMLGINVWPMLQRPLVRLLIIALSLVGFPIMAILNIGKFLLNPFK